MNRHESRELIERRLIKVDKISKYDPECGKIWPQYCQYEWNIGELMHASDEDINKIESLLDEMYGETMMDDKDVDLCSALFDNNNRIEL